MSVFIGYPSFMAYQMMKGKNEVFPTIPGTIARYSALGLTNEEMSKNPVWVDKTGNGHDLQMKNFAWSKMSGVGGYEMNFNSWINNIPSISDISMSKTTSSASVSVGTSVYNNNLIYIHKNNWDINKNHWLKVTSTYKDGDLTFIFYKGIDTKRIELPANGYVNIPAYPEFEGNYMYISTTSNKQGSFTIEQLPLYPGALVFDGVDDYGTCDNFPILTKEKGYTVVALRSIIDKNIPGYLLSNNVGSNQGAFIFERTIDSLTASFGKSSPITVNHNNPLTYQTTSKYNQKSISVGELLEGGKSLVVGRNSKEGNLYVNAAIWELVFLDHDATEEELTKIKYYFVKTYPWLFPDQAWTVVGKTNEDEDRATIANITGNGNNLVLSNFGFAEGSGYGLYAYNFNSFELGDNVVKPTDVKKDSFRIIGIGDNGGDNGDVLVLSNTSNSAAWKIRITGMKEGDSCIVGNATKSDDYIKIIQDGIYTFQKQYAATSINGIWYNSSQEVDVLVEQIPEYEGYLVTDGVDDKAVSKQFKFGENFTVILDFKFPVKKISYCGFDLSSKVRIQNLQGSGVYVVLKGNKTLIPSNVVRAITSEGKVYDENWNEYNIVPGNISSNYTMVNLGFDGSNQFAESATKLAGIYSSTLSKDDCIKAYNYLQTLKAK